MAFGLFLLAIAFIDGTIDSVKRGFNTRSSRRIATELKKQGLNDLGLYIDGRGVERELSTNKPCQMYRNSNGDRVLYYKNGKVVNFDEERRNRDMYLKYTENLVFYPNDKAVEIGQIYGRDPKGRSGKLFADRKDYHKRYIVRTFKWKDGKYNSFECKDIGWANLERNERRAEFYMDYDTGMLFDISDKCREEMGDVKIMIREKGQERYHASKYNIDAFIKNYNEAQKNGEFKPTFDERFYRWE